MERAAAETWQVQHLHSFQTLHNSRPQQRACEEVNIVADEEEPNTNSLCTKGNDEAPKQS
jgi:hypothetical protein